MAYKIKRTVKKERSFKVRRTSENEVLFSPETGEQFSASKGDYWNLPKDHKFKDSVGNPMQLVRLKRNSLGNQEIAKVIKNQATVKDLADIV